MSQTPKAGGRLMMILGVPISVVNMTEAVSQILLWVQNSTLPARKVFVREVASLMLAVEDDKLLQHHFDADMIVPDGMPLVLLGKLQGYGAKIGRIAGADLVERVCKVTATTGNTHYFYGGKPGVAQKMANRLVAKYPSLQIAGVYCPPLRDIHADTMFDDDMMLEIEQIKAIKPDFIWVGISSPKQEFWMAKAAPVVGHGVFLGVGAAFDFVSGELTRAPSFMRDVGLEWLYRLIREPRRLWRRYLILAPKFVFFLILGFLRGRSNTA